MPAEAPRRFQGDGFDYRRPVVSSNNVIDLTDEDVGPSTTPSQSQQPSFRTARPPRFGREIIDVEEEASSGAADGPDSPEIQFVLARRIEPAQQRTPFELDDDDEDEVEFVSENPLPDSDMRRSMTDEVAYLLDDPAYRPRVEHLRERVQQMAGDRRRARDVQIARVERMFAAARRQRTPHPLRGVRVHPAQVRLEAGQRNTPARHIHVGFIAPALNFGAVGFDMGFEGGPAQAPPPPPPTYNAPALAPEGFTRSPQEEDVLLCPNCEDELCAGDSDQKRQVWLVKGCGHVYCGECMMNRHIKKSAKGKEKQAPARTKPFKECVVEGCQKKVSPKNAVIQVFL
ncbi:uncharacterized protein N0V89_004845 [Didymosphaeria variabile]|uniref:RING-type domain-containing protein n=1 Tax=Didymosphaeria variabile TaxID=1932322 RepID=A0A9W8XSZ3_9PLEO|nr:uncharacterized protein N0V89_004845 [Didymosphaeria variabile]KAJ4356808.1 hypothetical protein N0V89_004845 [Didymosphaeria variabile]